MGRKRRPDAVTETVNEALAAEELAAPDDRQQVAERLQAVLDALPPAPSSPLDAGIRGRMREAAAQLARRDRST